jgi:asparagine synthase (glutamine-hydrolysing)
MCGIFALINNSQTFSKELIQQAFQKGVARGPEYSELKKLGNENIMFGFHRLAINGLNNAANQPLTIENIVLICNGEIYNYKELYGKLAIQPTTLSDCEVIIHLYKRYGMDYTLQLLDGVFAFALYDGNTETLHVARDPYGVRPLYSLMRDPLDEKLSANEPIIAFASELKVLTAFNSSDDAYKLSQFEPGSYMSMIKKNNKWTTTINTRYHTFAFNCALHEPLENIMTYKKDSIESRFYEGICLFLNKAVEKRVVGTTERPIACLLSGGLDSSLIAALVNKYYKGSTPLETYSIGMEGSEDLRFAEIVAKHINSKHTSIVLTENDFFNAIPEVIAAIESYDTTTVRASVGNYLIGKYIKAHSNAKVIFNGDGSDELTGGYLYFQETPDDMEFDKECKRLLKNIHAFDVLRSDKSISSHGLEPRTPFLDRSWVDYYLDIPSSLRNHVHNKDAKEIEKYILRLTFSIYEPDLLPLQVLWRKKEAFSDGVSGLHKSWYEIIRDKLENYCDWGSDEKDDVKKYHNHNVPKTNEQRYYRNIYDRLYPNTFHTIPYFWMPRYIDATDASARTLKIYKK